VFWDSSALVPLLIPETRSAELTRLLSADREPVLWWGSPVECLSALYRRHREAPLSTALLRKALKRLDDLVEDMDAVNPSEDIRRRAGRLLATHPLRAADALQLAAALAWCDGSPRGDRFVCLDERLGAAALREGFALAR
jgi:hypothetical protein